MNGIGINILKKVESSGELALHEIAKLIPSKYKGHRDFLILASLFSNGLLIDGMLESDENPDPNAKHEQILVMRYFACSTSDKKAEYNGWSWMVSDLKNQRFALTGKRSLYLNEMKNKRFDRIFTLSSGILVGIIVTIVALTYRI